MRGDSEVTDAVREAVLTRQSLRIVGCGTWLDGGHTVEAPRTVSLAHDTGVVEYTPGDLTITVRAGTTLREVDNVLLAHDQWLPLDPIGGRDVSIGATVVTCSYGPLAELFGTPRDQVLGLTVVTGNGEVLRLGGRVVKNVAGFDLTRLMIGSWGTLGIVTQVTLRVRGRQKTLHAYEHIRRAMPSEFGCREPVVTHAALSRAIKRLFDPHNVLNPGVMGEGEA